MIRKAFLGTGLLGSAFIRGMISRGDTVQAWNRTPARSSQLEQFGATLFTELKDAVRGAAMIHLALKDDASVDQVLEDAREGFESHAIIIDHTTTSKEGAISRTGKWKERGITYLHAPVFMGPANALDASGYMLVSGDTEVIKAVEEQLSAMTGRLINCGPEVGKAAALKLAGNAFIICLSLSLKETASLAQSLGLTTGDLLEWFEFWKPGEQVSARLKKLTSPGTPPASWELSMARKDTGLFLDAAEKSGTNLTLLPFIAGIMDEWIRKGFGNHDWTIIGNEQPLSKTP